MLALLKLGQWFEIEIHHVYKFFRVGQLAICFARKDNPWNYFDAYREYDGGPYFVYAFTWELFMSTNG
jgi:hypothetical protein